ncbi:coat protein [Diatom colony associated dsRNA virus 10]|uniref:coat protein n=1 Tax=Diatom colony associated dsRNA virus 10 TaxID=1678170 RepID=UPI0007A649CF|nr:coat protein [Diatom colony associated dsRNA virus 10]BAU79503.1 coat protein [Diatom colony associated dsRNA virus 10]
MPEGEAVRADTITGLISNTIDTVDDGMERHVARYRSVLTTQAKIAGINEPSAKSTIYNVNCTPASQGINLVTDMSIGARSTLAVELQEAIKSEIRNEANNANALRGGWDYVELAGVVAVLGSGLAYYRFHKKLTQEVLSGGTELKLESARSTTRPISPRDGAVFLGEYSDRQASPCVIAAMVGAVSGAGGTLFTKDVAVNPANNAKVIPDASGKALATGCYDALVLLAKNYNANGAGAVFAFALIVGLHRVGTVEGHTDEGGFMRELLRRVQFPAPYGAVSLGPGEFSGLPDPTRGVGGFDRLVDSLLLQSAGLVADCDPLVESFGNLYPTTLVSEYEWSNGEKQAYAGLPAERKARILGMDGDALECASQLRSNFREFSTAYVSQLPRMFGTGGCERIVSLALEGEFMYSRGHVFRHLKMKTANPYYWIEPTGVVRLDTSHLPAVREGYGTLCRVNEPTERPAFDGITKVGEAAHYGAYEVEWVSARKHAMLQHLTLNKDDGLAHIKIRRVPKDRLTGLGVGAIGRRDESLENKIEHERGAEEYLWGRGHSAMIAPGELNLVRGKIGFIVERYSEHPTDRRRITVNHAPLEDEMDQKVTFSVLPLMALGWGDKGNEGVARRVERDKANDALSACRDRSMPYFNVSLLMPKGLASDGDLDEGHTAKADAKVSVPEDEGQVGLKDGVTQQREGKAGLHVLPPLDRSATGRNRSGAPNYPQPDTSEAKEAPDAA